MPDTPRPRPRLLDREETDRQLREIPGLHRDAVGSLVVALRAPTFADAVRLVTLVAQDAEQMDHHPDVDLRWTTVVFTLATHSAGGVTQLDVELGHRVLEAGEAVGAQVLPPPQRLEVALDVLDPDAARAFWKAALGYVEQAGENGTELRPRDGRGPRLWFQRTDEHRPPSRRFHLDVYVPTQDEALRRLAACTALGGRLASDEFAPSWWVVADPEGNEVCLCVEVSPAA